MLKYFNGDESKEFYFFLNLVKKMQRLYLLGILILLLILFVSGSLSGANAKPSEEGKFVVKFRSFQYVDKEGIGMEAFRMLIPSDWTFDGKISWILDNPAMPATLAFKVKNPNGTEELEVFPNRMYFWTNNQMHFSLFPIGSRYFGAEVRPVMGAIEFVEHVLIRQTRNDTTDLKIIGKEKVPGLIRQSVSEYQIQGVNTTTDAGKVKIEYIYNGKPFEEIIFAVIESYSYPIQTLYGPVINTNWIADYLFSFKAEKGKLDPSLKTFQTIVNSFQLNPLWFSKYNMLVEYLIRNQIQRINAISEISKIISRTSNEISNMMMESYNNRQEVYDKIAENFSQAIRGVETYYNPIEQRNVELPFGYKSVWVNSLGEYILSDDPTFNPNIGSNLSWEKLEPKKR